MSFIPLTQLRNQGMDKKNPVVLMLTSIDANSNLSFVNSTYIASYGFTNQNCSTVINLATNITSGLPQ